MRLTGEERSRDLDVRLVFRLPIPGIVQRSKPQDVRRAARSKIVAIVERQPTLCTRGVSYAALQIVPGVRAVAEFENALDGRSGDADAQPGAQVGGAASGRRIFGCFTYRFDDDVVAADPKERPMNGNPGRIALVVSASIASVSSSPVSVGLVAILHRTSSREACARERSSAARNASRLRSAVMP